MATVEHVKHGSPDLSITAALGKEAATKGRRPLEHSSCAAAPTKRQHKGLTDLGADILNQGLNLMLN